jgi:hypothetical protein
VPHRPQGSWTRTGAAALAGLALVVSALLARPPADAAGTLVQVTPAHIDIGVGRTGDISIAIVDVTDLYSAGFVVAFNPAIAEVVDVDPMLAGIQVFPGSFPGPSGQPGSVITNSADNLAGTVSYEFTLVSPATPVSGSGTLATIRFVGKAPGATSVLIQSATLTDESGDPIGAIFDDGTVSVYDTSEPSPTPTVAPTQPPTETPTETPTEVPTETPTPVPSATATETASPTPIPSATATGTASPTPISSATATETTSPTPTGTPSETTTPTSGGTPTATATGTAAAAGNPQPSPEAPAFTLVPEEPSSTPALVHADPLPPQAPADPGGAVETPSSAQAGVSDLPSAGEGGSAPLPWRPLMAAAVIVLAGGGSWAFYYLTRGATPGE